MSPRRLTGAVALAALAVLSGAATACSGAGRVDTRDVERSLIADYVVVEGVSVDAADCPNQVDRGAGGSFICTVTVDGQDLAVRVVQVDDDGTVRFEQQQVVFDANQVAIDVAAEMGRELGQPVTATCGSSPLIVADEGELVRCDVVDENGTTLAVDAEVGDDGVLSVTPA
jgi:hypothetical protein